MATSSIYYLNAPSLGSATAIFTDSGLTTCAPNGFYSDGVIVREQIDCVLLPQQICPACDNVTYNCVSGTCVDPGDGTGTYANLEACEAACSPPPISLTVDSISSNACAGTGTSLPTYLYTGTATLCGCTSLNAANATSLSAGTYYVSDGTNTRQFTSTGGGSTLLTAAGSCTSC